ncbi:hypothetical protein YT1_p20023 (plasmid) [Rhodococcus ruber]|nr:hypothetical protein YT1_p20023 [Rhodococcus ruber]
MSGRSRGAQGCRAGARCPPTTTRWGPSRWPVRAPFRCAFVGHHTADFRTCVRLGRYGRWAAGRRRDARADFGKHRPAASFRRKPSVESGRTSDTGHLRTGLHTRLGRGPCRP